MGRDSGSGIILKGQRIVIPKRMKTRKLKLIHEGHMGIEKCKRRARDVLYWPITNREIYETVSRCDVCQEYRSTQPKWPLQVHETPNRPWANVGCDIKHMPYLLTVDYYSHYPEIALLSNEANRCPMEDHSLLERFSNDWGIDHKVSRPNFSQSNGLAENGVEIEKRILHKATDK